MLRLRVTPGAYVEVPLDPDAIADLVLVLDAVEGRLPGEGRVFTVKRVDGDVHLVAPTPRYAWSKRDVDTLAEGYRCTARGVYGVVNPAARCPSGEEVHAARVRVERRVAEWLAALSRLGYRPTKIRRLEGVVWRHAAGYNVVPLYPRRYIGDIDHRFAGVEEERVDA